MEEALVDCDILHLPDVRRNAQGTPLVSSIFGLARQASDSPFLAYLNADILLLPDCLEAVEQVQQPANHFLMVGRRWDLAMRQPLDFSAELGRSPSGAVTPCRPLACARWQRLFHLPAGVLYRAARFCHRSGGLG